MTDMPVGERKQLAPPVDDSGPFGWARKHLFSSWGNGLTTVVLIVAMAWILSWFLEWAVFTANFTASTGSECRGGGACWALIREKARLIFFGTFPYDQQWRPFFAVIIMLAMLVMTLRPAHVEAVAAAGDLEHRLVLHLPADVRPAPHPAQPVPGRRAGRRRRRHGLPQGHRASPAR